MQARWLRNQLHAAGQVWINTETGVYHREGSRFYGTTRKGKYMTEQDAIQAGYKPAPKRP
jgi:hypothetical protein